MLYRTVHAEKSALASRKEDIMPVIRIDMMEGRTQDQKRGIVKEITETMTRIAGTKPEDVRITSASNL